MLRPVGLGDNARTLWTWAWHSTNKKGNLGWKGSNNCRSQLQVPFRAATYLR